MSSEENIEELVDKVIDETLTRSVDDAGIKKRRPKPFRYLTDKNEIREELAEQFEPVSVMTAPDKPKIVEDFMNIASLGDVDTIENVIRKHQVSKKFNEK